jgi:hypothetical protein
MLLLPKTLEEALIRKKEQPITKTKSTKSNNKNETCENCDPMNL